MPVRQLNGGWPGELFEVTGASDSAGAVAMTTSPGPGPQHHPGVAVHHFCSNCGTALDGARFCPQCGTSTEIDGDVQRVSGVYHGHQRWLGLTAAALAVAIAAGAVIAVLLVRHSASGPSTVTRVRQAVAPVIRQNRELGSALAALSQRSGHSRAAGTVQVTMSTARAAQHDLAARLAGSGDRGDVVRAQRAMTSEIAWLSAAATVLRTPGSPMTSQLSSLEVSARANLSQIDGQVPAASDSLPGSASLLAYAHSRTSAARNARALRAFSDQVQSLLMQSAPAFQQINDLFRQMQAAASGGTPTITVAQAEAMITSVVANRTSLAASARTLNAPTPAAVSVRNDLTAAMDASLTNDQDINRCLNEANTGTVAYIFQSCLSSTSADSNAATAAKQRFLAAYNALRQQIGQPAISVQF